MTGFLPLALFLLFAGIPLLDEGGSDDDDTNTEDTPEDGVDQGDGTGDDGVDQGDGTGDATDPGTEDIVVTTDPTTGALSVTAAEGTTGSLVVARFDNDPISSFTCCSFDTTFTAAVLYVPEGVNFEDALSSIEGDPYYEDSPPDIEQIFEGTGVEPVTVLDLGRHAVSDPSQGGDAVTLLYSDTRTPLPEIQSNLPIDYYLLSELSGPVDSADDLGFFYQTGVYLNWDGVSDDEYFQIIDQINPVEVEDGDTVNGTDYATLILSPPSDLTAVTIIGGGGEDTISAGLNDTIITNDDTETDVIEVDLPRSFAEIYEEVPVLQAGPEDVVDIQDAHSAVITYAQTNGAGVTEYIYHVVSAPNGIAAPQDAITPGSDPISIEAYYKAAGVQLLAVGSLGTLDQSDPLNPVDTRVAAPQFDGVEQGYFAMTLQGTSVATDTALTTTTGVSTGATV